MLVKQELKNLGIHYSCVDLGLVEINGEITEDKRNKLKAALLKSGLELMDDKKSILIEKIKIIIREHLEKYHPPKKFSKQKKIFWPLSSECRNFRKLYELTNESLPISISRKENKP
jgi:hypothetical protein